MAYQAIFERREIKYRITAQQKEELLQVMAPFMAADPYGHSTIRNVYFDTDSYRLIRRSIEKPAYKEKLRIRSYARPQADDAVFVELKKKYTVIMVTHNMQQAVRVSDKTAFFLMGELVEFGSTEQIFSMPRDRRTEEYITGRFG